MIPEIPLVVQTPSSDFRIWKDNFTPNLYIPVGIGLIGITMSVLVYCLAYKNARTKIMLQDKNKNLYDANKTLEENEKHMKKLQLLLLESDEKHRNLFEKQKEFKI